MGKVILADQVVYEDDELAAANRELVKWLNPGAFLFPRLYEFIWFERLTEEMRDKGWGWRANGMMEKVAFTWMGRNRGVRVKDYSIWMAAFRAAVKVMELETDVG